MKKIIAIMLVIIMILGTFAACGKTATPDETPAVSTDEATQPVKEEVAAPADPVKLSIILQAADDVRLSIMNDYIIPNFEAEFPGYELEITTITGSTEDVAMMKTYNSTGDLPDVYWSDSRYAIPMITAGSQLDLTDVIASDGFADNFGDTSMMNFKGGIYALQPGSDSRYFATFFYNKEIFAQYNLEVPTTLDEFYAVCDTLVANGVQPFCIDGTGHYMSAAWLQALIASENPADVQRMLDNEMDFADPAWKAAYEKLDLMYSKGYCGDRQAAAAMTPAQTREAFAAGETAMILDFYWQYSVYDNGHTGAFLMPSNNANVASGATLMTYSSALTGYAVNANSENLDAAIKLAEFCCEQEAKYHNENGTATVFETGIALEAQSELQQELVSLYEAATNRQNCIYLNTMDSAVSAEYKTLNSAFAAGQYSVEEILDAQNAIFAENTFFE